MTWNVGEATPSQRMPSNDFPARNCSKMMMGASLALLPKDVAGDRWDNGDGKMISECWFGGLLAEHIPSCRETTDVVLKCLVFAVKWDASMLICGPAFLPVFELGLSKIPQTNGRLITSRCLIPCLFQRGRKLVACLNFSSFASAIGRLHLSGRCLACKSMTAKLLSRWRSALQRSGACLTCTDCVPSPCRLVLLLVRASQRPPNSHKRRQSFPQCMRHWTGCAGSAPHRLSSRLHLHNNLSSMHLCWQCSAPAAAMKLR